jgi:hypothetical protein
MDMLKVEKTPARIFHFLPNVSHSIQQVNLQRRCAIQRD